MKFEVKNYWYLILGIILVTISHMTFSLGLVAWVAYTPFLIYLNKTKGAKSKIFLVLALNIAWSFVVAKIISPPLIYAFVFMYSIPIAFIHLPGFLIWDLFKRYRFSCFLFPSVLTLMEWLQYTYTPLASWGVAAYTQVDNLIVAQMLSVFGMPGLSFLIYWFNISIAKFITSEEKNIKLLINPVVILLIVLAFGSIRINSYNANSKETIAVAAIGTDCITNGQALPTPDKIQAINNSLFHRSQKAALYGAKIIVWNEAATIIYPKKEKKWKLELKQFAKKAQTTLVASYIVPISLQPLQYENKYILIDSSGKIQYNYRKHEPVPGEPAIKGNETLKVISVNKSKVGGLICYDYDFPYLAKEYGKLNLDIIALPSSDWRGIDPLHTQMASFRAIEQGNSIIRSTRFGLSAVINPIGDIVSKLSSYDASNKILIGQVPAKKLRTTYQIIGDSFILAILLYLFLFFLFIIFIT